MKINKADLGSSYGWYDKKNDRAYFNDRIGLDSDERAFVICHENQHHKDKKAGTFKSEMKANIVAAARHPRGFVKIMMRAVKEGHKLTIPDMDIDVRVPVAKIRW